jgi:aspartyl-tRNA(Asn)/glutamyl-tRNA(Gln) amidotransferase subunit C
VSITRDHIAHLAMLSRITMDEPQLEEFARQLDVIVTAVARVQEVAGDDIPPTTHAADLVNVFRSDVPEPCLGADAALAQAPAAEDGRFKVPRILSED